MAAIGATVIVLAVFHRRDLRGRFRAEAPPAPHNRTFLIVAASVCVALGPAFVSGIAPAIPASAAALVLVGTLLVQPSSPSQGQGPLAHYARGQRVVRRRGPRSRSRPPRAARQLGHHGTGTGMPDLLRISAFGAGTANVANNLPAY